MVSKAGRSPLCTTLLVGLLICAVPTRSGAGPGGAHFGADGGGPGGPREDISGESTGRTYGVRVVEVIPGSPLERAGARAGDLLLRWHRPPAPPANPEGAEGVIESALHWSWLGREQAPRGDLLVTGERGGQERTFVVGEGEWTSQVEDRVLAEFETEVAEARARIEAGEVEPGIVLFDRLIERAAGEVFRLARCSVRLTEISALQEQRQWERAHEVAESARADSDERLCQEAMLERIAWIHRVRARPDEARQVYEELLALRRSAAEGSLLVAVSLSQLGALLGEHGDLDASEGYVRRALEIRSKEAPGSISEAISLNHLGLLAWDRRRLREAEDLLRRAHDIVEQRDPESSFAAVLLNNLGAFAHQAGRLEEAETWYRRSVEIHRRRDPLGRGVARGLANLGVAAMERGDFRRAESYLQESLSIDERESLDVPTRVDMGNSSLIAMWIPRRSYFASSTQDRRSPLGARGTNSSSHPSPEDKRQLSRRMAQDARSLYGCLGLRSS